MPTDFISLFTAALVAATAPIIAKLVPRGLVPETVILLLAGALLGPYMAGVIELTDSIDMLSELGLAFLFLLAGFEIYPKSLSGKQGKKGLATWFISMAIALVLVLLSPSLSVSHIDGLAVAIALTTTALGTLMPIIKERDLEGTPVGEGILSFGTWGELCPVLAMALLLSSRSKWQTLLILAVFILVCVIMAIVPAKARRGGHRIYRFLASKRNTTSQAFVRVTVVLLIGLVTVSAVFQLDIVLGAFAAGFILRYVIPEGDHELESKLDAIGYGFLIPVFFVVSGAKIDLAGVGENPLLLVLFICALLLVRAVPIVVALSLGKGEDKLSMHNRITVALYCTTALPLIVAVTSVAVKAGAMTQDVAGTLVAAGAVTVFLMPFLASLTYRVIDAKPIAAVQEIAAHPSDIRTILHEHLDMERMMVRQEAAARLAVHASESKDEDIPWQEAAFALQRKTERKRALDALLDSAAQDIAAHKDEIEQYIEEGPRGDIVEKAAQQREERRKRLAQAAVREHRRRQSEIGRMMNREKKER